MIIQYEFVSVYKSLVPVISIIKVTPYRMRLWATIIGRTSLLYTLFPLSLAYNPRPYYEPWSPNGNYAQPQPVWRRSQQYYQNHPNIPFNRYQRANIQRANIQYVNPVRTTIQYDSDGQSSRLFPPDTLHKVTETLGAINTLGRYLVNMTRGETNEDNTLKEVPDALYTLSKYVLGRNITDTIAPIVREALPETPNNAQDKNDPVQEAPPTKHEDEDEDDDDDGQIKCTTPDGLEGYCDDLSNCPQLLLNLENLRQSLCFKSIFVPGVCCQKPGDGEPVRTTVSPLATSTIRTLKLTTYKSTKLKPVSLVPVPKPIKTTTAPPKVVTKPTPSLTGESFKYEDCGQQESANFRVVGGQDAIPGQWPWMAAIYLQGVRRSEFWCGGSLITLKHVLTAAHCTIDSRQRPFSARQFTVRLGDVDLKDGDEPSTPVTMKVSKITAHPQFTKIGFYNDIAIMSMEKPVRKTKYIIPICLPSQQLRHEQFVGRKSTVVGWGTTYYGGKESPKQKEAILPVWRNQDCNNAYFQPITSSFICAGYSEGGTDACQGDSGGPLMVSWDTRWTQIGIVSFGNKCGEPGYPGVYTRVTEYLDWIEKHTRS